MVAANGAGKIVDRILEISETNPAEYRHTRVWN